MTPSCVWQRFFFESNQFFDHVYGPSDWQRLRDAYPQYTDDQLLDAKEATYGGQYRQFERDARPNYGFRWEHDGEKNPERLFQTTQHVGHVTPVKSNE